jgi:hypothetical protein
MKIQKHFGCRYEGGLFELPLCCNMRVIDEAV